jgi:hypothetical protein
VSFELGLVSVDTISSGIKYNYNVYYKVFIYNSQIFGKYFGYIIPVLREPDY